MSREKQEREENEPLTLEELRGMDGKPVWIENKIGESGWGLVSLFWQAETGKLYVYIYDNRRGARNFSSQEHGHTWLAYRRPPEQ